MVFLFVDVVHGASELDSKPGLPIKLPKTDVLNAQARESVTNIFLTMNNPLM
jgi:hypothetical protein